MNFLLIYYILITLCSGEFGLDDKFKSYVQKIKNFNKHYRIEENELKKNHKYNEIFALHYSQKNKCSFAIIKTILMNYFEFYFMKSHQRHLSYYASHLENKISKSEAVLLFFKSICNVIFKEKKSPEVKVFFTSENNRNINTNDSLEKLKKDFLFYWKKVITENFLNENTIIHMDNCLFTENDFKFFVKELIPYFYLFKLQTNHHIFINLYFENETEKNTWMEKKFGNFFCIDKIQNNFNTFLAIRYENFFNYGNNYDATKKYSFDQIYFVNDNTNPPAITILPAYTYVLDIYQGRSSFFDIKLVKEESCKNYEKDGLNLYKFTKKYYFFEFDFLRAEKFFVTLSIFKKELVNSFDDNYKIFIKGNMRFDISNCKELNKFEDTYFGENLYLNDAENYEKYNLVNESSDTKIFLEKLEKFLDTEFFAFEKFLQIKNFI
ncbi:hypothetical protein GVAV_000601 [Gurleya vavrai]